jgi:hypothetical protein
MAFFDIKSIILLLVVVIVYIMYKEINNIKKKILSLTNAYENISKKIKNEPTISTVNNEEINSEEINSDELNNELFREYMFKTIHIPITKPKLYSNDIEIINISEISSSNSNKKPNKNINETPSNIQNIDETPPNIHHSDETQPNIQHSDETPLNIDKTQLDIQNIDEKSLNIDESQLDIQNIDESTREEIYSNEENNNILSQSSNENILLSESKQNEDLEILKNIYKYKLPELQDVALKFKLIIQTNNKKKTKQELINDIKNFIINKNI